MKCAKSTAQTGVCLAVFLFLCLPGIATSASSTTATTELLLRPTAGNAGQSVLGSETPTPLGADAVDVTLRPSDRLLIKVDKINPVLFQHSLSEAVTTPTESSAAASVFADALEGLFGVVKGSADPRSFLRGVARVERKLVVEELDIEAFIDRVATVLSRWAEAPAQIDASAAEGNGSAASATILEWDSDELLAQLRRDFQRADVIRTKIFTGQKLTYSIRSQPTVATSEAGQAALGEIIGKLPVTDQELANRLAGLVWVLTVSERILQQAADLAALKAEYKRIGSYVDLGSIDYLPDSVVSRKVTISANMRFQALLSPKARAFQAERSKTVEVVARPYEGLHVRVSPAVFFSFVSAPDFKLTENDQDQLVIAEDDDDLSIGGAVSIQLIPDKWFKQHVQPFYEVGVGPTGEDPALFGGLGLTVGRATVSFGFVYQKVNRLAGGLNVGAVVASADDLMVEKEWQSGAYFSIAGNFGKKSE